MAIGATKCAKLQSNHHHQQTNNETFYRPDALLGGRPTSSVKEARKGKISHSKDLFIPSSPGVFQLCP